MPTLLSPADFFETVGRDPRGLIGQPETEWLDFKKEPYHLDDDKHRFELAKDVSAMANAGRGVIVIGVETTKEEDWQREVASELRPVEQSVVDQKRMQDIIHEWVYPRLDTEIRSHPVPGDDGLVWTVLVERQE